jgi:hypothetical protein
MRIESRNGQTALHLERGERHEIRVAGQNHVHFIFNAAGRKIYTFIDVGAAVASSTPHVRIRIPWGIGWNGERIPLMKSVDNFIAYALSGDWRRGARLAS